jgi:hypothetical protein
LSSEFYFCGLLPRNFRSGVVLFLIQFFSSSPTLSPFAVSYFLSSQQYKRAHRHYHTTRAREKRLAHYIHLVRMPLSEDYMVPVQQAYYKAHRSRNTASMDLARANDTKSHLRLKKLLKQPQNIHCADCTSQHAGWGVLPWGTFVCIDCAQIHRLIGKHVSQTKGINTNTYLWHEDEIAVMQHFGNAKANGQLLARHPSGSDFRVGKDASQAEKERFVRAKYDSTTWLSTPCVATRSSSNVSRKVDTSDLLNFEDVIISSDGPSFFSQFGATNQANNRLCTKAPSPSHDVFSQFDTTNAPPPNQANHAERTNASSPPSSPQPQHPIQALSISSSNTVQNRHDVKAANVMAAFRRDNHCNQSSGLGVTSNPMYYIGGCGFIPQNLPGHVEPQVVSRHPPPCPSYGGHFQSDNKGNVFNTGFFESFGLSAN